MSNQYCKEKRLTITRILSFRQWKYDAQSRCWKRAQERDYWSFITTSAVKSVLKAVCFLENSEHVREIRFHESNTFVLIFNLDSSSDHKIDVEVEKLSTPSKEEALEDSLENRGSD